MTAYPRLQTPGVGMRLGQQARAWGLEALGAWLEPRATWGCRTKQASLRTRTFRFADLLTLVVHQDPNRMGRVPEPRGKGSCVNTQLW
jgi:hypothetical protein